MGGTEDNAEYTRVAARLADALVAAIPEWVERVALQRLREAGLAADANGGSRIRAAAAAMAADLGPRVREVLTADVDAGAGSPLAVVRDGVGPVTAALGDLGVPPRARDDFATRHFPDDLYDLAPAGFVDIDPPLHEPGLAWGATRAHVHLRRRETQS